MKQGVTVIIPTYNGAKYLAAAIKSVYAQTLSPVEIIVVDDNSPDDTAGLAQTLAKTSTIPMRVAVLPQNSGGPAVPLNTGIALANTKFIAILEQDDEMALHRLHLQHEALNKYSTSEFSFAKLELFGEPVPEEIRPYLTERQLDPLDIPSQDIVCHLIPKKDFMWGLLRRQIALTNSSYMFTKKLWKKIGGFDASIKVATDYNFALSAAKYTDAIYINTPCVRYRYASGTLCRSSNIDWDYEHTYSRYMRLCHPDLWPADDWWHMYWTLRKDFAKQLSGMMFKSAAATAWILLASGAIQHHLATRRVKM